MLLKLSLVKVSAGDELTVELAVSATPADYLALHNMANFPYPRLQIQYVVISGCYYPFHRTVLDNLSMVPLFFHVCVVTLSTPH